MYDNTEKFITSAYRRKLEEDKKWQESQKLKYVGGAGWVPHTWQQHQGCLQFVLPL